MTIPGEALLLAFAALTLAAARALAPQAPDARDGELETPQHRDTSPRPNTPGAEGARFLDDLAESGAITVAEAHEMRSAQPDFAHLIALIAALFALWFLLSGLTV